MSISAEIEEAVLPVVDRHGCDLVLATFRREKTGPVLRLLIERRGATDQEKSGVDHRLCAAVSRDVSAALDVLDIKGGRYVLEVSSPGIERPLVKPRDFERFAGRAAALVLLRPLDGRRRFRGTLRGTEQDKVLLETADERTWAIPAEIVKTANLVFDPPSFSGRRGD